MGKYKIEIKKSALKEIKKLPSGELKRVLTMIESLSDNPRSLNCIKLSGEDKYRVRVGDYRIVYLIEDNLLVVYVVKVGHRKDVYRRY